MFLRNIVVVEEPPEPPEPPDPNVVAREKYEEAKEKHRKEMLAHLDSIRSERNRFIETKTDQSKSYDQTILTFSAGAIGLSITFVEKIAPSPFAPGLLYVAWSLFGLAVLSVVVSFLASQAAFQNEIDAVDGAWNAAVAAQRAAERGEPPPAGPAPQERPANTMTKFTKYLNWGSGGLFVGGIVFFVLFGVCNWPVPKEPSKMTGTPIKIEISGEVMPGKMNVVTTTGAAVEVQKGATPNPALLSPMPQLPAPTPAPTTMGTDGTSGTAGTTATTATK